MFKETLRKLQSELSGNIAYNHVAEISRHHRIQASPGFRDAANYAAKTLQSYGLKAEVLEYLSDGEAHYWSSITPLEWDARDAELRILEPKEEARVLARYLENKISIIQRSYPTPSEGVEAELFVLEKGEENEDYKDIDLTGKIVLTRSDVSRIQALAVEKHGAIGIIYDGMRAILPVRPEHSLDDALAYTSFWWAKGMKPCFGFVLTPREGAKLRELAKKLENDGKRVKLYAKVDTALYPGKLENVNATIPGETDEEVILVAHLCHPQPSANDNASGSGTVMEAARALHTLIQRGELARPKRTIRFLLVPEMAGTYSYLATNEESVPRMVAAINLDMVGENQTLCGGPLIFEKPPEAMSTYVSDLGEAIFEELRTEAKNLSGSATYAMFKYAVTPFSGGSDHYIYSDPTVGVPCPMIIQWPDKFYHTSWDTIDKVDPEMLRKVGLLTATYAYFIANAGRDEALWLCHEVTARFKADLSTTVHKEVTDILEEAKMKETPYKFIVSSLKCLRERVEYKRDRGLERLASTRRLVSKEKADSLQAPLMLLADEIKESADKEYRKAERAFNLFFIGATLFPRVNQEPRTELEAKAERMMPKRIYRGPVSLREYTLKLSEQDREDLRKVQQDHRESSSLTTLAMFWTDGIRNLLEISKLVELESGKKDLEYLVRYYEFLQKMGLLEIRTAP